MPVTMAKTPNSNSRDGKSFGTKVPFKKVFSSSHLQTNFVNHINNSNSNNQINSVNNSQFYASNDFGTLTHANLSSQLSSSLPGILDDVTNNSADSNSRRLLQIGGTKIDQHKSSLSTSINKSSQNSQTQKGLLSSQAVISATINSLAVSEQDGTQQMTTLSIFKNGNGIPFSAVEPSLIVSLGTYLTAMKDFDPEKLTKEIDLMLIYFQDVVRKDKLEQLVGSSTILLETVGTNCSILKNAYLHLQQVQLRLQLLSNVNNSDDCDSTDSTNQRSANLQSSSIVEATNDLYRNLSELLQWADDVGISKEAVATSESTNSDGSKSESKTLSTRAKNGHELLKRKSTNAENIVTAKTVSDKLLQSFRKLVLAYRMMEIDLRQCYENYLNANKQMADLILADSNNSSIASQSQIISSLRRRSVTPPPDYNRSEARSFSGASNRIPNGSTSTISSYSSSSSSNSSNNFLSKHRFIPHLISNQAQKMAHHIEKKLTKNSQKDSSPSMLAKNLNEAGAEKHSWSFLPSSLFGTNNLKRSESASDISSMLPRNLHSDIPIENLSEAEQLLLTAQSATAYRNRSIAQLRKSSDVSSLPQYQINSKQNSLHRNSNASQPNRHSDEIESRQSKIVLLSSKEMIFNPLYFSPCFQAAHSISSENILQNSIIIPVSKSSALSSPPKTRPNYSPSAESKPMVSPVVTISDGQDKPPPLPPKTYQQPRSISSTRSSLASNASSNSSTSSKEYLRSIVNADADSGLGMQMQPTDIISEKAKDASDGPPRRCSDCSRRQSASSSSSSPPSSSPNSTPNATIITITNTNNNNRRAIYSQENFVTDNSSPRNINQTATQKSSHCGCRSRVSRSAVLPCNDIDLSQVTLRPKKNPKILKTHNSTNNKCLNCNTRRAKSPPPLPPPDSYLQSMVDPSSTVVHNSSSHKDCNSIKNSHVCCDEQQICTDDQNKENCNCSNCPRHSCIPDQHRCHLVCPNSKLQCNNCGHTITRQVRTYRRQNKTQSMAFTKAFRSYSIAESCTKSTYTEYLNPNTHMPVSHSTSFPHQLSHSASIGESLAPPPLPPKRRNMHEYMIVVGNYCGPSDASDLFRFSRANLTKSLMETSSTCSSARQHSESSSIMSLSSSASSSSSLSTNASNHSSMFTATVDHLDKQQYLHLPFAPPPPTITEISDCEQPDKSGTQTPPPPLLPPRRDKSNDLPPAPPPPSIPSTVVQQQRMQQAVQSVTVASSPIQEQQLMSPRCSTPVNQQLSSDKSPGLFVLNVDSADQTQQPKHCNCHLWNLTDEDSRQPEPEFDSLEAEVEEEEEELDDEDEEELDDEEEDEEVDVQTDKTMCCAICSEGTIHSEDECCLAQIDVPCELLSFKSSDEEDYLGDLDIRGGTVDALVIKATQASSSGADSTFLDAFLATYRSFLSPQQLIHKLIFRYNKFCPNSDRTDNIRQSVARKVVSFIILLVNEIYIYDFNKSVSNTLMEFIYQLVGRGDLVHAKCLREKCYEKIRQRDREYCQLVASKQLQSVPHNVSTRTATLLDFKSEHLAEQMTLLDSRLFHKIETPEILEWAREQKEELIPNLSTFTEHFNKMSFWTRSQILRCEEHKEREKYVLKFLKIMKHLRKLNNFNSYLAILSALGSAPISRLDWQKNITETLKEYNALIDSSASFRTYRNALGLAKAPCIPYIGLILQDLTFIHVGNNDFLPDGKLNFSKQLKQYNIVKQVKEFKQSKYMLNENEAIITFFDNFDDYLPEEVMWQISESIKPRGGGASKDNNNSNSSNNNNNDSTMATNKS